MAASPRNRGQKTSAQTVFNQAIGSMHQFFEAIDTDGNGSIDPDEFQAFCSRLDFGGFPSFDLRPVPYVLYGLNI